MKLPSGWEQWWERCEGEVNKTCNLAWLLLWCFPPRLMTNETMSQNIEESGKLLSSYSYKGKSGRTVAQPLRSITKLHKCKKGEGWLGMLCKFFCCCKSGCKLVCCSHLSTLPKGRKGSWHTCTYQGTSMHLQTHLIDDMCYHECAFLVG